MQKFDQLTGVAAPLPMMNVDTDMIIPKQFLKTIKRTGLGKNLFDEMRYTTDGKEIPDFVLNKPQYRKAQILVAGANFGCGSSREHAPWALLDFGIRCVIAPSFADIFYNNCFKNGILPIALPQEDVDKLMDDANRGANAIISVDLEKQEIRGPDGGCIKFEIDAFRKHCLLNGLDDIGLTMQKAANIDSFEAKAQGRPALAVVSSPTHSVIAGRDPAIQVPLRRAASRTLGLPGPSPAMTGRAQCSRKTELRNAHQQETADPGRRRHRSRSDGAGEARAGLVRQEPGAQLRHRG